MKRTISKSERPYRLLLCVMISLLVIMLAGCSTSSDSDTNTRGFTDFATIEEEYLTTIESLNWPEGFTPPDALEEIIWLKKKSCKMTDFSLLPVIPPEVHRMVSPGRKWV